jgi:hypothetical protein
MVDNLHNSSAGQVAATAPLAAAAAKAAATTAVAPLEAAAAAWWDSFWAVSSVTFPGDPQLESLWNGASYILACAASR